MKIKNIVKTAVLGFSLLAFAGTASAGISSDINIYGASAQFIMWKNHAKPFMESQTCTGVKVAQLCKKTDGTTCDVPFKADGKSMIARGTCDNDPAYNFFRMTAKASYAGILAIQGNTTHPYQEGGSCAAGQIKMINEATCDFTSGQCTGTKCVPVTVGASDVPVECFTQTSEGALKGPNGGTYTTRNFLENPISWSGAEPCKPLVVPFGFFVNKGVKKNGTTITNVTRDHAEIIFNGQAFDWADLVDSDGVKFDANSLTACLRHAGSGTQASIDAYLTSPLAAQESPTQLYFNDGSSDEMTCVNMLSGAIGYADADQALGTTYANVATVLTLNGVPAAVNTIAGGDYNFYGVQHLYGVEAGSALCDYAGDKGNINPPWVAKCQMVYDRVNGCEAFPLVNVGATCP